MKPTVSILMTLVVLLMTTTIVSSQNYSSASKVYYAPIQEKIYFAIDMNYVKNDSLRKNGGKVPNTLASVDEVPPIYKVNQDYEVGDVLRVLVEEYDGDDLYSYIKIVGQLDDSIMKNVDDRIRQKCEELFGAGKLETWPEKYIDDKGIRGMILNEKDVDSDYYVISSIENISANMKSLFGQEGLTKGDADNLVIFYVDEIGGDKYAVKEVDNFTSSFYKIDIRWKEKTGKKGKKIGGNTEMNLTDEDKSVTRTFEKEIYADGPYLGWQVDGWIKMNEMTEELVNTNSKYIEVKVLKAIDKAFSKIK